MVCHRWCVGRHSIARRRALRAWPAAASLSRALRTVNGLPSLVVSGATPSLGDARFAPGLRPPPSVAVQLLHALAALLRFERQRGRGPREEARNADRLAGFLAVAVAAVLDHAQ